MYLEKIILQNYRNYKEETAILEKGINIFFGKNAQGKTNFAEAVNYVSSGESFRGSPDREILKTSEKFFSLRADICSKGKKTVNIEIMHFPGDRKNIFINGVNYRKISSLKEYFSSYVFYPDDLNIAKGSPGERRSYFTGSLHSLHPVWADKSNELNRIIFQKNQLLKKIGFTGKREEYRSQLDVWDEKLAEHGSILRGKMIDHLRGLLSEAEKIHSEITLGKENIEIKYNGRNLKDDLSFLSEKKVFMEEAGRSRKEEIEKGYCLVGPHRDDVSIFVNGSDLRKYGSQGQQRTAVLSFKISEIETYRKKYGESPVLILDDVFSELDAERRSFLCKYLIKNNIQTLITTADEETKSFFNGLDYTFHEVKKGKIST